MSATVTSETFLDGRVILHGGDCLAVMASLPENSVDAIVCDPPYHLSSIVKRFGGGKAAPAKDYSAARESASGAYARASRGFMGKQWDGGDVAFRPETWVQAFRVLKPGGHLVAFSGTRTYHRMACAIEDAGFEIRDMIGWLYGSGFPKSHDVSKGIDRANGDARPVISSRKAHDIRGGNLMKASQGKGGGSYQIDITSAASAASAAWEGWGTALKPAQEPICLARKPISESSVAANVLRWGTGAINVDGCRIGDEVRVASFSSLAPCSGNRLGDQETAFARRGTQAEPREYVGRWPANIVHDGSDEVVAVFPESHSGALTAGHQIDGGFRGTVNCYGSAARGGTNEFPASQGSAARFFYTAKADALDRIGSKHPTVKPLDLMQWLVRLVTPPGGTVLDPFAGTGTTGEAAFREGFSAILIEREGEYRSDIRRRMALALSGNHQRARESARARHPIIDAGPLFGGTDIGIVGGGAPDLRSLRGRETSEAGPSVQWD